MRRFKVSAGLWILDTFAERYVPGGYHDSIDFDRQLDLMSGIPGLDGLAARPAARKLKG